MATATIYTITVSDSGEGGDPKTYFSLSPWCANPLCEGHDDGGKVFALPEGIAVGRDREGGRILYEKTSGRAVEIASMDGAPVLRYGSYKYLLEKQNA